MSKPRPRSLGFAIDVLGDVVEYLKKTEPRNKSDREVLEEAIDILIDLED